MAISKRFTENPESIQHVLDVYLSDGKPTMQGVADQLSTTEQNVRFVVNNHLSAEMARAEKALRYSRSKLGAANPMQGKTGEDHHNWIGKCEDGRGYLTQKVGEKRYFVHRVVMAEMLEIPVSTLPPNLVVHHLDEDPKNNDPDNLSLMTRAAHARLHMLERLAAS